MKESLNGEVGHVDVDHVVPLRIFTRCRRHLARGRHTLEGEVVVPLPERPGHVELVLGERILGWRGVTWWSCSMNTAATHMLFTRMKLKAIEFLRSLRPSFTYSQMGEV